MDRRSPIVGFNMEDFKHMIGSAKTNQSSIEQLTLDDVKITLINAFPSSSMFKIS